MTGSGSPCGACKFLRRKCVKGCVFAPYFCHEQAATHFAAIHKVFGASNVSKLLAHLPVVNLQAQLASLKEQAAQSSNGNHKDKCYGKLPSQLHDVQSWFYPHDSAMAPPDFNPGLPDHTGAGSHCENGFLDPTWFGNYDSSSAISSSSGEDRSSFTAFGGEAPRSISPFEQWGFQDADDLQSMAFGYAHHS
ncbi:hypothetical protein V6N11_012158 [Hibiscus sabdariffa]|uniref:LOB domain-containing protein n=1 Tax=Hibiscus sabdariffa TaxID=183260 RepID=A0ABR2QAM6_9ROSI